MKGMDGFRFVAVHKSFGSNRVLRGIDLEAARGERVVIIGGSGSGKSVMLKLITGLLAPDRGRVFVLDKEVSAMREEDLVPVRRRVGMLFQAGALFDSLSVFENVAFPLREQGGRSEAEIRAAVEEKLRDVSLEGIGDRAPSELSGGMRKRVALARTIAMNPDIILYDEPTTGLDPANAKRISLLIRNLHEKFRPTTCVVTHDMECARIVGGRFAFLSGGGILVDGPLEDIEKYEAEELRAFLGVGGGLE